MVVWLVSATSNSTVWLRLKDKVSTIYYYGQYLYGAMREQDLQFCVLKGRFSDGSNGQCYFTGGN